MTPETTVGALGVPPTPGASPRPQPEPDGSPDWVRIASPTTGPARSADDRPVRLGRMLAQLGAAAVVALLLVAIAGSIVSRRTAESQIGARGRGAHRCPGHQRRAAAAHRRDGRRTRRRCARAHSTTLCAPCALLRRGAGQGMDAARDASSTRTSRAERADVPTRRGRACRAGHAADPGRGQRPAASGEQVRAQPGQAARGVPAGLDASGTRLLFETYFRYDTVNDARTAMWRGFAGIMLSSLLVFICCCRLSGRCSRRSGEARRSARH